MKIKYFTKEQLKSMSKNELVRLYLEAMNSVNSGSHSDYDGVVCKDCKKRVLGRCYNYLNFHPAVADNYFCADGEVKEE